MCVCVCVYGCGWCVVLYMNVIRKTNCFVFPARNVCFVAYSTCVRSQRTTHDARRTTHDDQEGGREGGGKGPCLRLRRLIESNRIGPSIAFFTYSSMTERAALPAIDE